MNSNIAMYSFLLRNCYTFSFHFSNFVVLLSFFFILYYTDILFHFISFTDNKILLVLVNHETANNECQKNKDAIYRGS